MASAAEHLRQVPIFSALDDEGIDLVAACAMDFEAEAGHVLIQPGADGSGLFVLTEGVTVVELPSGRTIERGVGEVLGELSLLTAGHRTARVQAKTSIRGFAISRGDFDQLLRKEPQIAVAMLPVLAKRLAESGG